MEKSYSNKKGIKSLDSLSTKEFILFFRKKSSEVIKEEKRKIEDYDKFLNNFNPERDVIVSKEKVEIFNQLKTLSSMATKIEKINIIQSDVLTKVDELHAVQTGKLYQPKKRLTKKQIEQAELLELRQQAHLRMLNQ